MNRRSVKLIADAEAQNRRQIGPKAFYLEPCLILGSVILWLAVLPLAGLVWSATTLAKRTHAQLVGGRDQPVRSASTRFTPLWREG